ncbi:hypothetical protein HPP92_011224 [Vanilla planifolia]|uniref:Uncharacterized protein n=1 Tax=Vanilla planifolia TaxID=51239 RepID=A0A835QVA8_VANPL|nr:hypothetical protein HPP92_011224 [Vanilla planifolia]
MSRCKRISTSSRAALTNAKVAVCSNEAGTSLHLESQISSPPTTDHLRQEVGNILLQLGLLFAIQAGWICSGFAGSRSRRTGFLTSCSTPFHRNAGKLRSSFFGFLNTRLKQLIVRADLKIYKFEEMFLMRIEYVGLFNTFSPKVTSPLVEPNSAENIMEIDEHMDCAMSGLISDVRDVLDVKELYNKEMSLQEAEEVFSILKKDMGKKVTPSNVDIAKVAPHITSTIHPRLKL